MITKQTKANLSQLVNEIESRKEDFGGALVAFALSRSEKHDFHVTFGVVRFMGRDEETSELDYDWGRFRILRKWMSVEEAVELLRGIWGEECAHVNQMAPITVRSDLHDLRHLNSHEQYGFLHKDWPGFLGYADINESTRGVMKNECLSKLGFPMYPDEEEAIVDTMGLDLAQGWQLVQRIEVWVPDFRARIRAMTIDGKRIRVEVQTGRIPPEDVRVKFFSKGQGCASKSDDIPLQGSVVEFVAEEEPVRAEVHILSARDGTLIDRIGHDERYPLRGGVVARLTEKETLEIIARGENEQVEFTEKLNKGNPAPIMAAFVAFANTKGGLILLGVDDNGMITGIEEDPSGVIMNWVHSQTDPPVQVKVKTLEIQGKRVTAIEVPEGVAKPYLLIDGRAYVRRGATSRPVKRTELDELQKGHTGMF